MKTKIAPVLTLVVSCAFGAAILSACGGGSDCSSIPELLAADPTGRWAGVMVQQESDCGELTRGQDFAFNHSVSSECDIDHESRITLMNEDNLPFFQISFSESLANGSFAVEHEGEDLTIDIAYDNYDGALADVTQRIRVYEGGALRCSEIYKGQARKQ